MWSNTCSNIFRIESLHITHLWFYISSLSKNISLSSLSHFRPASVLLTSVSTYHLLHMTRSAETTNSTLVIIHVIVLRSLCRYWWHHWMMMSILRNWRRWNWSWNINIRNVLLIGWMTSISTSLTFKNWMICHRCEYQSFFIVIFTQNLVIT